MIGGERVKSALLERLSKEKPEHKRDEIDEALRRGYSVRQIVKALTPEMKGTELRQGKIFYVGARGSFEIPYTYEAFRLLCQLFVG